MKAEKQFLGTWYSCLYKQPIDTSLGCILTLMSSILCDLVLFLAIPYYVIHSFTEYSVTMVMLGNVLFLPRLVEVCTQTNWTEVHVGVWDHMK